MTAKKKPLKSGPHTGVNNVAAFTHAFFSSMPLSYMRQCLVTNAAQEYVQYLLSTSTELLQGLVHPCITESETLFLVPIICLAQI